MCFMKKVKKIKKLPDNLFLLFVGAKMLGAAAVAILLVSYFPCDYAIPAGWLLLVIAFLIGLPTFSRVWKK